jgi:hypothetical protein
VTARRSFPYEPLMTQVAGGLPFQKGALALHPFEIDETETIPRASHRIAEGEVVQPDVSRAMAERDAMDRILRAVQPRSALYAKYEPRVRSAALIHYPLHVVRYQYEGHARRRAGEVFHVVVSGRSGKIVGSRHPSAVRALARKFRQLIG